jgi:amino acid adenylation domain-containing protein
MDLPLTLVECFRETVERHPDAVAVDTGDSGTTYLDLDDMASRIVSQLGGLRLPASSRVAVFDTKRLETYAAYLAVARHGHTVVPLSPEAPLSRLQTIAGLARLDAIVVDSDATRSLAGKLAPRIVVADVRLSVRSSVAERPPAPDQVAYLLFTSGSTGRPKGVPISHAQASTYVRHALKDATLEPGARTSHTFGLTFDPSVFDLFVTWAAGATLVLPRSRELLTPSRYVSNRALTHWYSVPSLVSYARRISDLRPGAMPSLRQSRFIGEPLTVQQALAWHEAAPNSSIDNVYGPTELTVSCSVYRLPRDSEQWPVTPNGTMPIGRIYPALDWRIVDAAGRDDVEGELLVRGDQRFDGYLDETENAGRFAADNNETVRPLAPGEKVTPDHYYRTGDRVAATKDGLIHLGRLDRQIKLDGYRIELGEIEAVIRQHPDVIDVVVVTSSDGHDGRVQLVAAFVGDESARCRLSDFLKTRLPRHMVPTQFVRLEELPLNGSGKADLVRITAAVRELVKPNR